MKTMICYSNASCVTGKAIREKFDALRKKTNKRSRCDLFIRWGSTEQFPATKYKLELNSLEAVLNTTNKLRMLELLAAANIPVPQFSTSAEQMPDLVDGNGNIYIRSKHGVVRYSNDFNPATDMYYTKPVKSKRREYRVHVFNGKVIGIYEKVPMTEERPALFKSDTCHFKKRDPELCLLTPENQAVCVQAVQALGLLFGGVDVIRDAKKNIFICEVNSSPGLNTHMLDVYVNSMKEYYELTHP